MAIDTTKSAAASPSPSTRCVPQVLRLVLISDDAVAVHVPSHIAFFIVITASIGLVLKDQLIDRDDCCRMI